MKAVIAIDSFKGSLSTLEAGTAAAEGIKKAIPDAVTEVFPLADGGEGTVFALTCNTPELVQKVTVTGPENTPVNACYGIINNGKTAVIEIAAAAGITYVPESRRDPLVTTTYGVGEIISDAIKKGCRDFIIGLGGSATNDGGIGMLSALGFEFLDSKNSPCIHGAKSLSDIKTINVNGALLDLKNCTFRIASDVKNTLCGEFGCSAVFGPQKGATPDTVALMDGWLCTYANVISKTLGKDCRDLEGAGAAGGLGFAFIAFLNATVTPGAELVLSTLDIENSIKNCDVVVTGEGRLDSQTCMGKAPAGVAAIAKKYSKPVIAFSGCVSDDAGVCNNHGIDAFFSILKRPCSLAEAMDKTIAYKNLSDTVQQAFRLYNIK